MRNLQKSKLDMYNAVVNHCMENIALINAMPALLTSFNLFTGVLSSIRETMKQRMQPIDGLSITKRKSRRALARMASTIASKVYAYADAVGNDDMKSKVSFTNTEMLRFKDHELPAICYGILDIANENLAALAGYNVTAETNTSFRNSIIAYEALQLQPRNAVTRRVIYNTDLRGFFKTGDGLLKNQMDKIMADYMESNPAFFSTYMANRVIIDPATTSTQIKGKVSDSLSRKPLADAIITLVETGQTVNTKPDGNYVMKQLQNGTCSVMVSKAGFKSQTVSLIIVKRGKIKRVSFELEAV